MKMKSRKSGISLISLIITIIVIIILAAVVIFSGMDTPEKAQLSKVISDIDNVQTAVDQAYYGLYTEKAVAGEVWTKSQFYEAVATGNTNREDLTATGLIEIGENSLVDINLPKYEGRKWYIAVSDVSDTVKTGSAVLSPGFESQGKTYATLLDIQNGGSSSYLSSEEKAKLATIQIGDYVDYMHVSGVNWRVIDKTDSGIVTLTTSDAVGSFELVGADGYINLENKLDSECKRLYTTNSAIDVRCMDLEDLKKLCRKYQMSNDDFSVGNIEKMDIEELIKKAYNNDGYHARWVAYSENTPTDLVQPKVINGHTYYPVQYDGIFLTYDDENGNTHTAMSFGEGENGYKVPKYNEATNTAEPVLVSWNAIPISIPSEINSIIDGTYSFLASKQNDGTLSYVATFQWGSTSYEMLYSSDDGNLEVELPYHPIVTIDVKKLMNGGSYGSYNIWNVENSGSNLNEEKLNEQKLAQIHYGDYVNYMDTESNSYKEISWRVISKKENGDIYIVRCGENFISVDLTGIEIFDRTKKLNEVCKNNCTGKGALEVRNMTIEDLLASNELYKSEFGENFGYQFTEFIEEKNIGKRYAVYSADTPEELMLERKITFSNGETITYEPFQLSEEEDKRLFVYDDLNGNQCVATKNVESIEDNDGGYKVPKYENGEAKPVLITTKKFNYYWFDDDCILTPCYITFGVMFLGNCNYDFISSGINYITPYLFNDMSGTMSIEYISKEKGYVIPIVKLNVSSLEKNDEKYDDYNVWNIK